MAKRLGLVFLASAMFFACAEPDDSLGPVFSNLTISVNGSENEVSDTIQVNEGDLIVLEIEALDDSEISETKVNIEAINSDDLHPEYASWNELTIENSSGSAVSVSSSSQIPTTAQGDFKCDIEALDEFGNLGSNQPFYFHVESRLPTFEIDSVNGLSPATSFSVMAMDTLLIKGGVSSTSGIDQLLLTWWLNDIVTSQQVVNVNAQEFMLDPEIFTVPDVNGDVELRLSAANSFGTRTCVLQGSVSN